MEDVIPALVLLYIAAINTVGVVLGYRRLRMLQRLMRGQTAIKESVTEVEIVASIANTSRPSGAEEARLRRASKSEIDSAD